MQFAQLSAVVQASQFTWDKQLEIKPPPIITSRNHQLALMVNSSANHLIALD